MTNINKSIVNFFKENCKYIPVWLVKSGLMFLFLYFQFLDYAGEWSGLYIGFIFVLGLLGLVIDIALTIALLFILAAIPPKRIRESGLRKLIPDVLVIALGTALMFGLYFLSIPIGEKLEALKIHNDISHAEAVFEYDLSYFHLDGIEDIDTQHSLIIVDYDSKTAAFLHSGSLERYKTFPLTLTDSPPEGLLQCDIPLPSPGAAIKTYRPSEENWGTTCSIALYMEDGSVYAIEDIPQKDNENHGYYGLNPTETPRASDKNTYSVIWSH